MKDSEKVIAFVVVAYIVLAFIGGSLLPWEWSFVARREGLPSPVGVVGMFDVDAKGYNTLDISTTYVENTAFHCYWYGYRGGWIMLGKGQTTVELIEQDGGYLYAVVKPIAGQALYVDWSETKAKNPRVESVSFEDVDNDGYKDFIFKLNMANIPKPATGNPKMLFYPYFLAYEKPSINTPSDLTGCGTAKVIKYVEWYLYFTNPRKAFAISKIEITINTTDVTKVTIKSVAVPGGGTLSGDMLGAPLRGVNSLTYTYTFGTNLYNALYLKYPANVLNKFYATNELELDLESGDVLSYTITFTGITVDGSVTTITDTVLIKAASS
ncbi:MAG: hypothetical protein QXU45_09110 [Candidatus Bathyarchaeia archaeon]